MRRSIADDRNVRDSSGSKEKDGFASSSMVSIPGVIYSTSMLQRSALPTQPGGRRGRRPSEPVFQNLLIFLALSLVQEAFGLLDCLLKHLLPALCDFGILDGVARRDFFEFRLLLVVQEAQDFIIPLFLEVLGVLIALLHAPAHAFP